MPEAVDSNSTTASVNQPTKPQKKQRVAPTGLPVMKAPPPFGDLPEYVQRDVEATQEMLRSHATMVAALLETGDDFSLYSNGVHAIHQLIMSRLDQVLDFARLEIEEIREKPFREGQAELFTRIGEMVCAAYTASGEVGFRLDDFERWDDTKLKIYFVQTRRFRDALKEKAGGSTDLLTIGSLLPWLQMTIYKALAPDVVPPVFGQKPVVHEFATDKPTFSASPMAAYRAELAKRLADEGHSIAQISQIMNIKRSAVERILDRLTSEESKAKKTA